MKKTKFFNLKIIIMENLNKEGRYILIAYRYGHKDGHSYLVDLCSGIDTATERADAEAMDRGGKYSVSVFAVRTYGEIEEVYEAKCPEHYTQGTQSLHQAHEQLKKDIKEGLSALSVLLS
jgi:hypothetical protein